MSDKYEAKGLQLTGGRGARDFTHWKDIPLSPERGYYAKPGQFKYQEEEVEEQEVYTQGVCMYSTREVKLFTHTRAAC